MDIFIEPIWPGPRLEVMGDSPVAAALRESAPPFGYTLAPEGAGGGFCVVATQGRGDLVALRAALSVDRPYVAFVGSRMKWRRLAERLTGEGIDPARIGAVRAPAGLDIGAVTPEEIALSILSELVSVRRRGARHHGLDASDTKTTDHNHEPVKVAVHEA